MGETYLKESSDYFTGMTINLICKIHKGSVFKISKINLRDENISKN